MQLRIVCCLQLVLLPACIGVNTAVGVTPASQSWKHGWDTPAAAWWGYGAMGTDNGDDQLAFVAKTYKVVVFSKCVQPSENISVSDAILNLTQRVKALIPNIKVLQYFNVQMWACYLKTDPLFVEFMANKEMWLKDDNGNTVLSQFGTPSLDYSNKAAVDLLVGMPIHDTDGNPILDGYLFDGAAVYNPIENISSARNEALKLATWKAAGLVQQRMTAANGGLVLANGMEGGPIDPFVNDTYNLGVLDHVNGIENERGTPTFELVNHATGAFYNDKVAANLAAVEKAAQLANGSKVYSANHWAGPIVGFKKHTPGDNQSGFPVFAAGDQHNVAPDGTRAEIFAGWTKILTEWFPFNLAMFLIVAGESSYFTQMVWYAAFEGFLPCPDAPDSCMAPTPFYPEMHKPLGPPAGPRQQLSAYKWVRHFEHATVTVDLDEPLGPGTAIVWK